MKLMTARGMSDYSGQQKLLKEKITKIIIQKFENYGFNPLQTPIIERYDVLASKYAGGAEILKEIYKLKDQGGRELALRYDLTVPLARFLAMNPELKLPFKRYQIGEVFRDGPMKKGRTRQFEQYDADVVGDNSVRVEAELLKMAQDIFEEIGLKTRIRINNMELLKQILKECGVKETKILESILIIDKLLKIGEKKVKEELEGIGLTQKSIEKIFLMITTTNNTTEQINKLEAQLKTEEGKKSIEETKELLRYLDLFEVKYNFDTTLSRGLAYYTGAVYEVFLEDNEITSAICAGGRYDKMIGGFVGNKQEYPSVGISFGMEAILIASKEMYGTTNLSKTNTQILIINIKQEEEAIKIANELRKENLNVEIAMQKKSMKKNMDYANSYSIPYVLIVGENEIKEGKYVLRDMKTGKEEKKRIEEIKKYSESKMIMG